MIEPWRRLFLPAALLFGLAFLYAPIVSIVVLSFNASSLVTVWGGFSLHWYATLLDNGPLVKSVRLSLVVALMSASIATWLGTTAGYVLSRFGPFRGRTVLFAAILSPLVMPEIVIAIAMLLLFVALEQVTGWPQGRGILTIVVAHATYTTAFVTVVIRSRLARSDVSLEEAAADLGAAPATVFGLITLPLLVPGIAAGWLLAFSLSLDDVVLSAFTSGPGSTTLPLVLFSMIRTGVKPDVNAVATLIVVSASVLTALVTVAIGRGSRRAPKDGAASGLSSIQKESA